MDYRIQSNKCFGYLPHGFQTFNTFIVTRNAIYTLLIPLRLEHYLTAIIYEDPIGNFILKSHVAITISGIMLVVHFSTCRLMLRCEALTECSGSFVNVNNWFYENCLLLKFSLIEYRK
jgi:hypothetical protein